MADFMFSRETSLRDRCLLRRTTLRRWSCPCPNRVSRRASKIKMDSRSSLRASRRRMSMAPTAPDAAPAEGGGARGHANMATVVFRAGDEENEESVALSARERAIRRSQALDLVNKRRQKPGKVAFGSKLANQERTREEIAKRREQGLKSQKRLSYRELLRDNEQFQEKTKELEDQLDAATKKVEHLSNVLQELDPSFNLDNVPEKSAEALQTCLAKVDSAFQAQLDAAKEASEVASKICEDFEGWLARDEVEA